MQWFEQHRNRTRTMKDYVPADTENVVSNVETEVISSESGSTFRLLTGPGEGANFEKKVVFRPLIENHVFFGDCHVFSLVVFAHDRLTRLQNLSPYTMFGNKPPQMDESMVGGLIQGQIYNPCIPAIYIAGYIIPSTYVPNTR